MSEGLLPAEDPPRVPTTKRVCAGMQLASSKMCHTTLTTLRTGYKTDGRAFFLQIFGLLPNQRKVD